MTTWFLVFVAAFGAIAVASPEDNLRSVASYFLAAIATFLMFSIFERRVGPFYRGWALVLAFIPLIFTFAGSSLIAPLFPDNEFSIYGSILLVAVAAIAQFFVNCPKCGLSVFIFARGPFSTYAFGWCGPVVTPTCPRCKRSRLKPSNGERPNPRALDSFHG